MEPETHPCLEYVGHMATFYIPRQKLSNVERECHEFFLANYDAYTFEDSNIQGYWRPHPDSSIFEDENVKYVVSFQGDDRVFAFIDFLSQLCGRIGEECIYLTMGYKSWLVWPKGSRYEQQAR
jgi:hypothetical protein